MLMARKIERFLGQNFDESLTENKQKNVSKMFYARNCFKKIKTETNGFYSNMYNLLT